MINNNIFSAASSFANIQRIKLHKQTNFFDLFLFVEGGTDILLFNKIKTNDRIIVLFPPTESSYNQPIDGSNKEKVIRTISILNKQNTDGILGLVDNDYDSIMNKQNIIENLLYTVEHDIETTFFSVKEMQDKFIGKFFKTTPKNVFNFILDSLNILGSIRLLHEKKKEYGNFYEKNFNTHLYSYDNLVKFLKVDLKINKDAFIKDIYRTCNVSGKAPISLEKYNEKVSNIIDFKHPIWKLAQGHDLEKLLIRSIQLYGKSNFTSKSFENLTEVLKSFMLKKCHSIYPKTSLYNEFKVLGFKIFVE
jgi:hypothetical protein